MTSQPRHLALFLLLIAIVTTSAVGIAAEPSSIAIEPWPLGLIVYLGIDPPSDIQSDGAHLMETVNAICEFWDVEPPVPHDDWEQAMDSTRPSWNGLQFRHRWTLPSVSDEVRLRWYQCSLDWDVAILRECMVAIFPDKETLGNAFASYSYRAAYAPVSLTYKWRGILDDRGSYYLPGPVIALTESDFREHHEILLHEMTHWLFSDTYSFECEHLPGSAMRIVAEGAASLSEGLAGSPSRAWTVAAQFAEEGSLLEVPRPLMYSIGETVVEVMKEEGIPLPTTLEVDDDGYPWPECTSQKCGASSQCPDWAMLVSTVEEAWLNRTRLVDEISTADRVRYEAEMQRLGVVEAMLDPILDEEAHDILDEIRAGLGDEDSIDHFWALATSPPGSKYWNPNLRIAEDLENREMTFVQIAISNALYAAPPAPGSVAYAGMDEADSSVALRKIARLVGFRELELWSDYFEEYLALIQEIIVSGAIDADIIPWREP